MTRSRFQSGLDELKEKLLRMGGLAEQAIERAAEAYRTRDPKYCQMVFAGEVDINQAEREIDELALDLLAMQQPMAIDLRFILAVVKINADLERVGDQAVNVSQRVLDLISEPEVQLPVDIPRMAGSVTTMVQRALESFLDGKAEVAETVLQMDNIVDRMKDEAFVVLVQRMVSDSHSARAALNVLLISRALERIADHATNIAEDVIFWVRGADVRHGGAHYPV
jgi:phosphate transport system protein